MGEQSGLLFQKAKAFIPGGVNSPVRAGKAVGIDPLMGMNISIMSAHGVL